MNTWTCKSIATGFALTVLAASDGGQASDLIGGLGSLNAKPNAEALAQAPMAFGAVTLVPPKGYCIDGESLKPRFALMARCDRLGAENGSGAPVGVITISVTPTRGADSVPTPAQTADALALTNISASTSNDSSVVFRAEGPSFSPGMSKSHWRGSAVVKNQMLGLALYGPPNGNAVSAEGRTLLSELIKRTQETSK
jgi:hypothetical protein